MQKSRENHARQSVMHGHKMGSTHILKSNAENKTQKHRVLEF